jgi:hypothetical protein
MSTVTEEEVISFDFDSVPDMDDFSPMPEGDYLCELEDIEPKDTQSGNRMWNLKFRVVEGECEKRIIFDNMVFSDNEKTQQRVKLVCSRLGLNTEGMTRLTPDLLIGRQCIVSTFIDEYADEEGNCKKRNKVPFAGYQSIDGDTANTGISKDDDDEDDIPF